MAVIHHMHEAASVAARTSHGRHQDDCQLALSAPEVSSQVALEVGSDQRSTATVTSAVQRFLPRTET